MLASVAGPTTHCGRVDRTLCVSAATGRLLSHALPALPHSGLSLEGPQSLMAAWGPGTPKQVDRGVLAAHRAYTWPVTHRVRACVPASAAPVLQNLIALPHARFKCYLPHVACACLSPRRVPGARERQAAGAALRSPGGSRCRRHCAHVLVGRGALGQQGVQPSRGDERLRACLGTSQPGLQGGS